MPDRSPVVVGKVVHGREGNLQRLKAKVDGEWLWVELRGGELRSTPEAWASFALVPAMTRERNIRLRGQSAPEKVWCENKLDLMRKFTGWWGGAIPEILANKKQPWWRRFVPWHRSRRRLLFFSGGVDSFHSLRILIRQGTPPHALLFVDGFDIDIRDDARSETYLTALEEISARHGIGLLCLRTNLRKATFYQASDWGKSHGLAMAGVAHLIHGFGEIYISSSFENDSDIPYGSRFDVDPLFSSGRRRFHHIGAAIPRTRKMSEICMDPLVRKHLRVCWQGTGSRKNCGVCEKCIRTELNVMATGEYGNFTCFDHPDPLVTRLDRLETRLDPLVRLWQAASEQSLPPDLETAVKTMLLRNLARVKMVPKDLTADRESIDAVIRYCGYEGELLYEGEISKSAI